MSLRDPEISVVTPVYSCAPCIAEFRLRVGRALDETGASWEIVFVDDRSPDDAWDILTELAANDDRVTAIRLSRNFGQQCATTAGIAAAQGDFVVVIDCDLEDPPEAIPEMYELIKDGGFEVVLAKRVNRKISWIRRVGAIAFNRLLTSLTGYNIDPGYGSYSMITRKVRQNVLRFHDHDRHYMHMLLWLGFKTASVEIEQNPRFAGESSYTLRSLVSHAVSGMMFQTTVVLRWIIYLGFFATTIGLLSALGLIANRLANNVAPGWTSLAVIMLMTGGLIVGCLGVVGLYIGKIYEEVRQRPLFVVDEVIGSSANGEFAKRHSASTSEIAGTR